MQQLLLSPLQMSINQYLRLDPDTITRLAALDGKVVKIELSDWDSCFFALPLQNGLQLSADYHGTPDVIIRGRLISLARAGLAKGSAPALFSNQIEILGDTAVGEEMRTILQNIDIDWEEHLSRVVGDQPANAVMRAGKKFFDVFASVTDKIRDKLSDYLHYEARCFPTKEQVDRFKLDVATLRNDVDRAEARLHHLLHKKESH